MKIKALAALCAEAKELTLYDAADGSQWAGTGAVRYKLPESLGELSTNALCAIMDFGPDKLAKMRVDREPMPEAINTDGGTPYVVFKDGLFAVGVIAPMHPAPELVTWLSDVLGGVTVSDG